ISAVFAIIIDLIVALFTKLKKGAFFEGFFIEKILHIYSSELAQRAIKRGVPSLYVNFTAFDRRSHRLGKKNILTKLAIKNIDREIKKIYNLANKNNLINYDFFIITDHGQIESLPFKDYFKKTIKETIKSNLKTEVIDGSDAEKGIIIHQVEDLLNEIRWLKRISWFLRFVARRYYHRYCLSFLPGRIILISHGDVVHLYFNIKKSRIFGEEIEKIYPGFLKFLLEHKGIGLLVFISRRGIKILGKRGEILIKGNKEKLRGEDPLFGVFNRKLVLESIREAAGMKNAGDLIIFSSKIENNLLNFVPYFSCHAGIEKDEQEIFIISPNSFKMSSKNIESPKKLYQFFRKYSK
ncbi:MAG: alkaline phosphatase family protein, partial [Candidatus Nealsonbacteria bacterium]|nr:alkaline phosphatase family protein [Candidatus Nealsonbacteria bacterium]